MPVHDWSRVDAGIFHHFRSLWISEISNALNGAVLPPQYYAMAEQVVADRVADVLTLKSADAVEDDGAVATAVATAPPKVRFTLTAEVDTYAGRRRALVIRKRDGDRIVALVEILSPGNKSSRLALESFVDKVEAALGRGLNFLLIDLQAPTSRDPQGVHGAVWFRFDEEPYLAPADKPLTLAAYTAGPPVTAYVEPVGVGDDLAEMPLFLDSYSYVNVPLEATYRGAWRGVPRRWRDVLEPPAG